MNIPIILCAHNPRLGGRSRNSNCAFSLLLAAGRLHLLHGRHEAGQQERAGRHQRVSGKFGFTTNYKKGVFIVEDY